MGRSSMPSVITGVSEIAFWVEDLGRAIAFYRDLLGFEVESVDAGRNAFLRVGDLYIVLFNPNEPGTQLADDYLARVGGPRGDVYHVAFKTVPSTLDRAAEDLKSSGIEVKGPVEFATGRRSYFLEDPDGHYIELTDR
jgi:catechol 2,3-dioxygenase-like lactoylglutathione lyase family enzyme